MLAFPQAGRRHRELCSSFLASLAGSRWSAPVAPLLATSSSVLPSRPLGGRESFLFLRSHWGKRCFPQTPIQSSSRQSRLSSTGGCRRLNVRRHHSSSVLWPRLLKEAVQRASSSGTFLSCRLSLAGSSKLDPVLVRRRGVLPARPFRAAERACFSSLSAAVRQAAPPSELGLASFPSSACLASSKAGGGHAGSSSAGCGPLEQDAAASCCLSRTEQQVAP